MIQNEEYNQSIQTYPELTEMLELVKRKISNSYYNYIPYVQKAGSHFEHVK